MASGTRGSWLREGVRETDKKEAEREKQVGGGVVIADISKSRPVWGILCAALSL